MKNYMSNRPLADMESDGVYFPEKEKEIEEKEEVLDICHYSGLPSLSSYLEKTN
jgi:hypothetical protein